MDKRHANFLVAASLLIALNLLLLRFFGPPPAQPPAPAPEVAEQVPDGADQPPRDQPAAGEAPRAEVGAAAEIDAVAVDAAPQWVTLGSLDPQSDYRLLATFSNRGAAVERIELNQPQFKDLDTLNPRGGYLGHLAESTSDRGGCLVNMVGAGTPAALAGLAAGDVIKQVDGQEVSTHFAFQTRMRQTAAGQTIRLAVERDGQPQELSVRLRRYPLEVVKPEGADPLSYLVTLGRLGNRELADNEAELPGVDLHNATWEVLPDQPADEVAFRRVLPEQRLELVKRFRIARLPADEQANPYYPAYHLEMDVEVKNLGSEVQELGLRYDGPTGLPTEGWWYSMHSKISPSFWGGAGLRDVVVSVQNDPKLRFLSCENIIADKYRLGSSEPISYLAVDAQFFASALIPMAPPSDDASSSAAVPTPLLGGYSGVRIGPIPDDKNRRKLTNVTFRMQADARQLAGGETLKQSFQVFAGPKKPPLLSQYAKPTGLQGLVEYGWFWWVAQPMQWLLHGFAAVTGNYGLAIIMLTVVVRLAMFPLSRNQALNAQKMQELQPEIKRLAEKYKTNMEARGKAQQELFRKHNYNPLSGCLPLFIQLPIFMGLYRALSVDVELRQAPLISAAVRWASNLSAPDMLFRWDEYLPEFIAGPTGWLGPYFNLLPCITIVLFLWQQKMFMPPPTDEQAAMQQKIMQYMMIFIGVMFFKVPTGLCVYFIASSVWGIGERLLLPKTIKKTDDSAPPADGGGKKPERRPEKRAGWLDKLAELAGGANGPSKTPAKRKQPRRR